MTKLRVMSDLHLEFAPLQLEPCGEDVLVLAGDIGVGLDGAAWAVEQGVHLGVPVVYVSGNHEFYNGQRSTMPMTRAALLSLSDNSDGIFTYLDWGTAVVAGVRFIGGTLWTDFELFKTPHLSMRIAEKGLNDFRGAIRTAGYERWTALDSAQEHSLCRVAIERECEKHRSGVEPIVVVTHHAPSFHSVADQWKGDALSPCFASHLDETVIKSGAKAWVHGHTHHSFDYRLGSTRVFANPRGYHHRGRNENAAFDDKLLITVGEDR